MGILKTQALDFSGVTKVRISTDIASLTVKPSITPSLELMGVGLPTSYTLDVKNDAELLDITMQIKNWVLGPLNMYELIIRLPDSFDGDIDIASHTGAVNMAGFNLGNVSVENSTGIVRLGIGAKTLHVQTSTGAVEVDCENRQLESLELKSNTGKIEAANVQTKTAKCMVRTGSTALRNIHAEKIDIESGTGSVQLEECSGILRVSGGTGSVNADMTEMAETSIHTNTGSIRLRIPDLPFTLEAATNTGRIRTDFKLYGEITAGGGVRLGDEIRGTYNDGGTKVQLKTKTGSIDIDKQ